MRNFGLDVARSIAIIMVLVSHSRMFFGKYDLQWLSYNGLIGVEIFFVLSGFLIGRIIIDTLITDNSWGSLVTFYKRRWMRTLPLYFFVTFMLVLLGKDFHWSNIIFLQNFNASHLNFMPVSWSLAIEEWFYLIIPLLLILIFRTLKPKNGGRMFISVCIAAILVITLTRIIYVQMYQPTWDFGVRKQIFLRFDALLFGVILAGVKTYYKQFYSEIEKKSNILLVTSIVGLVGCALFYVLYLEAGKDYMNHSFFGRTLFFSVITVVSGIMIISLESNKWINQLPINSAFYKSVTYISITSYAVYLVHYELFIAVQKYMTDSSNLTRAFILILCIVVVYGVAYLLNTYIEKPFMKLRDRNTSKNNFVISKN
ncbi:acyltransferase [Paenibacillus sp. Lou8.1]|uniref:acyltransferase family protein n=1 Tax=Paenibacillus sp. Lou8.1 TaxID=2962041 RepID=UPI0020B8AA62|nr:acyltransferase [Paenibacillus sp. Lou8.1]MCP3806405.1 acyltransferase [Paenibacillus sp. Lou8.1]